MAGDEEGSAEQLDNGSFFDRYGQYIYIGLVFTSLVFAYLNNFVGVRGVLGVIGSIIFSILFVVNMDSSKNLMFSKLTSSYAKDPRYYFKYVKKYYEEVDNPRVTINLRWNKHFLYYPLERPSFIFLDLYDKHSNQDYVGVVRILDRKEQIRGLIPVSWNDFIRNKWFRLKMAGFASSEHGKITYMNKKGEPVSIPSEYYEILGDVLR